MGVGYAATPGIWSDEQTEGWAKVTRAVHDSGRPHAAAALACGAHFRSHVSEWRAAGSAQRHPAQGPCQPGAAGKGLCHARARWRRTKFPASSPPIKRGAENAKSAGFDGVEIHGANGYLLDQFLQDSTNHRSDAYGGTREKRARLMLEVADACADVWGADRVGMHLAPRADSHDMGDSDPLGTFTYVARELGKRGLAFLCAREARSRSMAPGSAIGPARSETRRFGGVFIANEGFTFESANRRLADGRPMRWRSANW